MERNVSSDRESHSIRKSVCAGVLAVGLLGLPDILPPAITLPLTGPVYFSTPTPELIRHEQCHDKRRREIGDAAFYGDYVWGGAAREERRCSLPGQDHPAYYLPFQKP